PAAAARGARGGGAARGGPSPGGAGRVPLLRRAVGPVPAAAAGLALAGLRDGPLVVTDDGAGIAAHLVDRLAKRGLSARVASGVLADAGGVIFLGGVRKLGTVDEAGGGRAAGVSVGR